MNQLYFNPKNISTIEDLLAYTKEDTREGYPIRSVDDWVTALTYKNETLESALYLQARAEDAYLGGSGTITGALEAYDLDALVMPTNVASNVAALTGEYATGFAASGRFTDFSLFYDFAKDYRLLPYQWVSTHKRQRSFEMKKRVSCLLRLIYPLACHSSVSCSSDWDTSGAQLSFVTGKYPECRRRLLKATCRTSLQRGEAYCLGMRF